MKIHLRWLIGLNATTMAYAGKVLGFPRRDRLRVRGQDHRAQRPHRLAPGRDQCRTPAPRKRSRTASSPCSACDSNNGLSEVAIVDFRHIGIIQNALRRLREPPEPLASSISERRAIQRALADHSPVRPVRRYLADHEKRPSAASPRPRPLNRCPQAPWFSSQSSRSVCRLPSSGRISFSGSPQPGRRFWRQDAPVVATVPVTRSRAIQYLGPPELCTFTVSSCSSTSVTVSVHKLISFGHST